MNPDEFPIEAAQAWLSRYRVACVIQTFKPGPSGQLVASGLGLAPCWDVPPRHGPGELVARIHIAGKDDLLFQTPGDDPTRWTLARRTRTAGGEPVVFLILTAEELLERVRIGHPGYTFIIPDDGTRRGPDAS